MDIKTNKLSEILITNFRKEIPLFRTTQIWIIFTFSQLLISLIIYEAGGIKTAYPNLFDISIIYIALTLGMKSGALAGFISGLIIYLIPVDVNLGLALDLKNWIIKITVFIFIGAVSGYISDSRKKKTELLKSQNYQIIETLVKVVDSKDSYTSKHSVNVSKIAVDISSILDLNIKFKENVEFASKLHDIGKIGIPNNILIKPTSLSDEEYSIIKSHTTEGVKIIGKVFNEEIINGINYHHERYDGKGYPTGLKGNDIPLISRVIHIADSIDAMLSNRAYRKALPVNFVIKEITENSGTQFDPDIAKAAVNYLNSNLFKNRLNNYN